MRGSLPSDGADGEQKGKQRKTGDGETPAHCQHDASKWPRMQKAPPGISTAVSGRPLNPAAFPGRRNCARTRTKTASAFRARPAAMRRLPVTEPVGKRRPTAGAGGTLVACSRRPRAGTALSPLAGITRIGGILPQAPFEKRPLSRSMGRRRRLERGQAPARSGALHTEQAQPSGTRWRGGAARCTCEGPVRHLRSQTDDSSDRSARTTDESRHRSSAFVSSIERPSANAEIPQQLPAAISSTQPVNIASAAADIHRQSAAAASPADRSSPTPQPQHASRRVLQRPRTARAGRR